MAYLRIYFGDNLLEQRELTADRTRIGRARDNDIVLKSKGVSKHHAVIVRDGHSFVLLDTHSSNGVYVNNKRVKGHLLNYWDEIQIFDHVLKFMATAKLLGNVDEGPAYPARPIQQDATMEVDISKLGDLVQLRRQKNTAYLSLEGRENKCPLDKVNFTIGRGRTCDLRLPGWLTPRVAARIQRRTENNHQSPRFSLIPGRRGGVSLNGTPVTAPVGLSDDDEIKVRKLRLRFYFRPSNDA